LLKDGSSFSKGTLTREEKSTQTLADTFSRRYLKKTDKIKVSGQAVDYPMFIVSRIMTKTPLPPTVIRTAPKNYLLSMMPRLLQSKAYPMGNIC
jgi:hypothetical protein